jgi:DNA modification methylase
VSVLRGDCVAAMDAMDADSVDAIVTDPPYGLGEPRSNVGEWFAPRSEEAKGKRRSGVLGKSWDQPGGVGGEATVSVLRGDCVEVMAGMEPDSVDAVVCDPPYGLEFMGKEWDRLDAGLPQENVWKGRRGQGGGGFADKPSVAFKGPVRGASFGGAKAGFKRCTICGKRAFSGSPCICPEPVYVVEYPEGPPSGMVRMQRWHQEWATAALRVAKPGAYLLAFGGTRTVHRMTCALEDAGWVIRDMLVWAYAQGFPKSRASLKPAWEPIVMARKPGASRDLNIDAARLPAAIGDYAHPGNTNRTNGGQRTYGQDAEAGEQTKPHEAGRWPANVILTDPILDGGWDGVVGGGEARGSVGSGPRPKSGMFGPMNDNEYPDTGTYSRFFLIPKAPTRERVLSDGRRSPHPTQKPEALIRHLVTLVTPPDGLVLDPFLGSGTLGVVCDGLGVRWLGIEREPEYVQWAEDRIDDNRPAWTAA